MKKNKVLLFDIETSPNVSYTWGKYDQNVLAFQKEWEILSIAWQWEDKKTVHGVTRASFKDSTDKSITKKLHTLLNQADVVIAHNGNHFDIRKAKAKFLEHGFAPPKPVKTIDTLLIARSRFNLNSNKLDDLGKLLGVGRKTKISDGIELWIRCMNGDKQALAEMGSYNRQDVVLLRLVYRKLRPWIGPQGDTHQHAGCPKCGSNTLTSQGVRTTLSGIFKRYQCQACGGWSRDRLATESMPKTNKVGL